MCDLRESVKVVSARLGHKDATETLNTYAHLWPENDDRSRDASDDALRRLDGEEDEMAAKADED